MSEEVRLKSTCAVSTLTLISHRKASWFPVRAALFQVLQWLSGGAVTGLSKSECRSPPRRPTASRTLHLRPPCETVDEEMRILSEVNQTETDTVWHPLCVESKMKMQMTFFTKQKRTHKGRKQMQLPREKWKGRDKLAVWDERIHTTIHKIATQAARPAARPSVDPSRWFQGTWLSMYYTLQTITSVPWEPFFKGGDQSLNGVCRKTLPSLPSTSVISSALPTCRLQFGLLRCV